MDFVLKYGTSILPFIIAMLYLSSRSKNKNVLAYDSFLIYITFIALIEAITSVMNSYGENNLFFSHIYFIGEFLLLSIFFKQLLPNSQKKSAFLLIISVVVMLLIMIVLHVLGYFVLTPFHPIEVLLCGLPILIFAILHLYNSLNRNLQYVYITFGIVIYKTISVLVFTLQNFTNTPNTDFENLFEILLKLNSAMLLVYYSLIIFEWFKSFKRKRVN